MSPPEPADKQFVDIVNAELASAHTRALACLNGAADEPESEPEPKKEVPHRPSRRGRNRPLAHIVRVEVRVRNPKPRSLRDGYCRACGVPWAEQTKGCHVCAMRHYQRASARRAKARQVFRRNFGLHYGQRPLGKLVQAELDARRPRWVPPLRLSFDPWGTGLRARVWLRYRMPKC